MTTGDVIVQLRWRIQAIKNSKNTGDVVTRHGDLLGTWQLADDESFLEFTPDGANYPIFSEPFMYLLIELIR